jgi:aspartate aminotransferase
MAISKKIEKSITGASWIRKMFEEGERLRKIYGSEKVYDFTLGNPELEPPAAFKEALKELALRPVPGMHRYMSNAGYSETRLAVARVLAGQTGLPFDENHVVMTCGAGAALNVVLKSILDPGDDVILLSPYFVEYKFYIDNHGGIAKEYRPQKSSSLI